MTTAWLKSGHGPAHLVTLAGSDGYVTVCARRLDRPRYNRVPVMTVIADAGTCAIPANCEACPECERAARGQV